MVVCVDQYVDLKIFQDLIKWSIVPRVRDFLRVRDLVTKKKKKKVRPFDACPPSAVF